MDPDERAELQASTDRYLRWTGRLIVLSFCCLAVTIIATIARAFR